MYNLIQAMNELIKQHVESDRPGFKVVSIRALIDTQYPKKVGAKEPLPTGVVEYVRFDVRIEDYPRYRNLEVRLRGDNTLEIVQETLGWIYE